MEVPLFKREAINALHYGAESYLMCVFEDANLFVYHAKRITMYNTYISLLSRIRCEISGDPSNKISLHLPMFLISNQN